MASETSTNSGVHDYHGETGVNAASSSDLERQPLLGHSDVANAAITDTNEIERGAHRHLSPDDPIVSPMNLYKVRALRVVSIVVLTINVLLFFLLLFSDFVAVPGFNARSKSFFDLDLLIICAISNLLTLWCFSVPAYYERIIGYIISGLIGLDFVVIILIPSIRDTFGLLGVFILLWTFATFIFNSLVDYWVEQGKIYQEIKYTGREETRFTVFEMFVVFIKTLIKFVLLLIVWNLSLSLWVQLYDSHVKPWGDLIPVNDGEFKVHLSCFGDVYDNSKGKQPIVLIEGGQLTSLEEFQEWVEELFHLNKVERYCIWDRPGYGFSESAPSPTSISIIVDYLEEALKSKGIENGPFSLVGFDIGGLYSRVFAGKNVESVHSILLVDLWHEDLLKNDPFNGPNMRNEPISRFRDVLEPMNPFTGFKLWVKGIVSPLGVIPNLHILFHPRKYGSSATRIFGRDMYWSSKYLRARLQEQVTSSILSYNEIKGSNIRNTPTSVISSDFMIKTLANWGKWQRELTKLSDQTVEWVVAESSQHKIWESTKGRRQLQDLLLRVINET